MRKKIYLSSVVLVGMFFSVQNIFATENSCEFQNGPANFLSEYSKNIETELEKIKADALAKNPTCNAIIGNKWDRASLVFDVAIANIKQMPYTITDMRYNFDTAFSFEKSNIYTRDIKIFSRLEKKIESTAEMLANRCGLDDDSGIKLTTIVWEIANMKHVFQKISLGEVSTDFSKIRNNNQQTADAIMKTYTPQKTDACTPKNKTQEKFFEKLSEAFNWGSKKEKMLETWKKAASMIAGTFGGAVSLEYERHARELLDQELSRQGFTTKAKAAMLRNFDCYKAATANSNNILDNAWERVRCLQVPITGWENALKLFQNFTWNSPTTIDLEKRHQAAVQIHQRNIDIHSMHAELQAIISDAQDINDQTRTHLINLHQELLATNERLEGRIPTMQSNCMKWQPDIIGWCKE